MLLRSAQALSASRLAGAQRPWQTLIQKYATDDGKDRSGAAESQHDEDMISNLKDTQGKADEKGGGKPRTSASSPVSVAQQADLGDDRGGKPQGSNEDPNATANDPQTVTAHDPDTGKESTSEKVGSAQRSRQPGSLSHPSATTR